MHGGIGKRLPVEIAFSADPMLKQLKRGAVNGIYYLNADR
jgi:hypothetical protein